MVFFERKPTPQPRATHFELATSAAMSRSRSASSARAELTLRVGERPARRCWPMPARGSLAEAHTFLNHHAGWLVNQMGKLPEAQPIADGGTVPSMTSVAASATSQERAAR